MPIVSHDRVIGVMNVQTTDVHQYLPAEVEFVEVLAAQVAGIIELSALRMRLGRQLALEHEAVERLTSLNASKSDLLAMLSHDFRGPLSIAKSYVFGLMARLSEPDLEACRELESELDSLAQMTDNLMLSLELEAQHQLVLDLEEFDLVDLVQEVCPGMRRTSPEHVIVFDPFVSTCVVTADRSKIRSVVVNLVGNATKYSPSGGRVTVDVVPRAEIVDISIQDEGIGLDARDVETIFERYGRGDTALQRGIRGHGLGLFICRRIAESHGGTIYARPRAIGSCFTLLLPRRQPVG